MAQSNPAFAILTDDFPYTVEKFREHVFLVRSSTGYTETVSFAMVAEVWALSTNPWISPRLPEVEFYRIIAEAALIYSTE